MKADYTEVCPKCNEFTMKHYQVHVDEEYWKCDECGCDGVKRRIDVEPEIFKGDL